MALLGEGPPAHEWHHQIEDDDVRARLTEPIEPAAAIGRLADQIAPRWRTNPISAAEHRARRPPRVCLGMASLGPVSTCGCREADPSTTGLQTLWSNAGGRSYMKFVDSRTTTPRKAPSVWG